MAHNIPVISDDPLFLMNSVLRQVSGKLSTGTVNLEIYVKISQIRQLKQLNAQEVFMYLC